MRTKTIFLTILSLISLFYLFFTTLPDGRLHITFCDVGQGDAAYIRGPRGTDIVIDGGPNEKVLNCLGSKMPFWDRKIELVILSHPQADHLTGLIEIVKRYQVERIIDSVENTTQIYKLWEKLLTEKKIKRLQASAGQKIKVDGVVELAILWPSGKNTSGAKSDVNDFSTIVSLSFASFSALFSGDANLTGSSVLSNLTVLKVPHHGSRFNLSEDFLKKVKPALAIISVGKNSYGHPHPETLKLLNLLNIKILRTDQDKTIEITTDGQTWQAIRN